jgi:hypothetical protein
MLHSNFFKPLALCSILLILACSQPVPNPSENFALLPSVAQNNFKSQNSKLDSNILKYAFSPSGEELPLRYGITQNFQKLDQAEKAHLEFSIQTMEGKAPESYRLEIKEDKIIIMAQDHAGLFYAFITLNQLLEDAKDLNIPLPILELEDTPKIAFRPIQIDVKHHLEKKSYYYDLIDELAQLKINGMIVEIEDKLQYKRRPEVASADALSIEEWSAISDYALARNIKISPLVQGLGHASFVLKHEKNKFLRDDPKSDWAFNPLDPETYALQYDLYLDALEAFPHGKYLHVGGDEVHTTGRGSEKSALQLNLIWLNKVTSFAAKHNRIPIFWDDMPLKQAGLMRPIYDVNMPVKTVDSIWRVNEPKLNRFIEQFPKNCVYMRWNYHRAESYGNGKAMDWFSSNGFQVMGATAGQTRWTLMPQREGNIDQIRIFAEQSINRNYDGLLLTLWDDDSPHFELYKRGIHAFAEFTWGGLKRSKEEFKKVYRHRKFGPRFQSEEYAFIDVLDQPIGLWTNLLVEEGVHRNSLNQHKNPIEEQIIDLPEFNNKGAWSKKYVQRLTEMEAQTILVSQVQKTLNQMQKEGTKATYNLEVYQQLGKLVNYNFELMQALSSFDQAQSIDQETKTLEKLKKLTSDFKTLRQEFENVYSQTRILNKPKDYILDQDHHRHPANQTVNFDWQFTSELMLLEKIRTHFQSQADWNEGKITRIQ